MTVPSRESRVAISIDLEQPGRQVGELKVKWSDNRNPLGYYLVPIFCLANGTGPTLLLTGGVHGDEFEGPAALMRLVNELDAGEIQGRIIILPALNYGAVEEAGRVSSIDGRNMNRAFPGNADGTPVEMIAHYIESILLPRCDAAIDLHSGGKASIFAICALAEVDNDCPQGKKNMALAAAFSAPYLWVMGSGNDDRSLNSAAARQGVAMIAAELGGGGGCDPDTTLFAFNAIRRCLAHLGVTREEVVAGSHSMVAVTAPDTVYAPAAGLFDRHVKVGAKVEAGEIAGWLHFVNEPTRASMPVVFASAGIILAVTNRGMLERGDFIALLCEPCAVTTKG